MIGIYRIINSAVSFSIYMLIQHDLTECTWQFCMSEYWLFLEWIQNVESIRNGRAKFQAVSGIFSQLFFLLCVCVYKFSHNQEANFLILVLFGIWHRQPFFFSHKWIVRCSKMCSIRTKILKFYTIAVYIFGLICSHSNSNDIARYLIHKGVKCRNVNQFSFLGWLERRNGLLEIAT